MARAYIRNVNNRGKLLLKLLKAEGRIDDYSYVGNATFEFEFHGKITIDFEDYMRVAPSYLKRSRTHIEFLQKQFKDYIVLPIINSLRGGELVEFSDTRVTLRDTSRERKITFRVTEEEYERLKQKAAENGITVSELIRSIIEKNM